jgi:putative endonuclease
VGSTSDLDRRLNDHNRGKEKFTRTGVTWVLVYSELFEELASARRREQEIKKKKSRSYIEQLISSVG